MERMIEYNIQDPTIERAISRESSSSVRVRPDDTLKWVDDQIFNVQSKPMKGLEEDDKAFGFLGN